MKCSACTKENISGAKFCKYCGAAIIGEFKTCSNGHNYDTNLSACPYCPQSNYSSRTIIDRNSSERTVVDSKNFDKTVIDSSAPTLTNTRPNNFSADKTVIFRPSEASTGEEGASGSQYTQSSRKLVGWLVTYDISPNGTDFRIYEGRTKIGKNNTADVVLKQPGVSDDHALLLYRNNKFLVQDQLSTNGTLVNGILIEDKSELNDSDIIKIGNVSLKIKII